MGLMHQVVIGGALKDENKQGGHKRNLRLVRNRSGGKDYYNSNEIEEVVIYQGRVTRGLLLIKFIIV